MKKTVFFSTILIFTFLAGWSQHMDTRQQILELLAHPEHTRGEMAETFDVELNLNYPGVGVPYQSIVEFTQLKFIK